MSCPNCGATSSLDDNFCRVCGCSHTDTAADEATTTRNGGGWPSAGGTTAVATAPRLAEPPVLIATPRPPELGPGRRSWLLVGGIATAGVLLVLVAALGFVLFTRGPGRRSRSAPV